MPRICLIIQTDSGHFFAKEKLRDFTNKGTINDRSFVFVEFNGQMIENNAFNRSSVYVLENFRFEVPYPVIHDNRHDFVKPCKLVIYFL